MKALILIDIQNDFLPGGALPVPHGDEVIAIANRLQPAFELVIATRDWHPPDHGSFAANHPGRRPGEVIELDRLPQVLWPVHCVQHTRGAEFAPGLDTSGIERVFFKGTDARIDSYSGFYDNGHRQSTGLEEYLRQRGVDEVHLAGLATDYCVKFTALDALRVGFRTHLIADACRGVELKLGDVDRAIEEVRAAGGKVITSDTIQLHPSRPGSLDAGGP
jgi:nicotinamidase/pyrazinamidase